MFTIEKAFFILRAPFTAPCKTQKNSPKNIHSELLKGYEENFGKKVANLGANHLTNLMQARGKSQQAFWTI